MKKIIVIILAFCMILALAACGGSPKKADSDVIKIGVYHSAF